MSLLTRRSHLLVLIVALLFLTVSFAGWRTQAERLLFSSKTVAATKDNAIPVAPPMFATLPVTNMNDNGAGSLRDAIAATLAGDTITFAVTGTITLTSGQLVIDKNLTIQGPGAHQLTISGNNASRVFNINSGVTVTIDGLTIANGKASDSSQNTGGGIANFGTLNVTNSTLSGNSASGSSDDLGGGIYNSGTLNVTNSTFSGNSASGGTDTNRGGGIASYGTLNVINSTFSGNSASGGTDSQNRGGGIFNGGTLDVTNSTLSGNLVSGGSNSINQGGGIFNLSSITVNARNTISAGNTAAAGPDVNGTFSSQGNNLIGKGDGSTGFTHGTNGDKVGTTAAPINPLLAPLENYGGPTMTHALLPDSPALDAGNNIGAPATDQRGVARPQNGTVDIGAYEQSTVEVKVIVPNGITFSFNGTTYTGSQTLNVLPGIYSLATSSPQTVSATQYFFLNWSDAGAMSHSVTVNAPTTITGTFGIVPPFTTSLTDPFVCNGIGSLILVTAQLTNPNATTQPATFNVTLPAALTLVPNTCTSSIGACTPTPNTQVAWSGNIPAGQSVTITYQSQIADGTPDGTLITINSTGSVAGVEASVSASGTVSCPGLAHEPENVKLSDQKAGSVVVFPFYTSKSGSGSDTKLHLSNTGEESAFVHLFFIDGATCNQADYSVCLTPNASINFIASEMDPDTTGWLLAVAVDAQGNPIQNNGLIGNAFVNDGNYVGNYGAESFWAYSNNLATINEDKATLRFNGTSYDAIPNQFTVEVQSPRDIVGQKIVTVGMSGDLTRNTLSGAAQLGVGVAYNGNEKPFGSFTGFLNGICQASATITGTLPRVPFTMTGIIPSGQVGTIKLNIGGGVGLLLTPQNSKKWSGIRGLHKTGTTFTTITIPVLPPTC